MKTFQHVTSIGLLIIGFSSSGCGTVKKVNAVLDSANQTAQSVNQLAKNFNETLNQLKAQAKTPTTAAPVSEASVPALPAMATGGIDTTKPVSGKSGSGMADIEGSGTAEPVRVFEADAMVVATNSVHTLGIATSDDVPRLARDDGSRRRRSVLPRLGAPRKGVVRDRRVRRNERAGVQR